MQLSFTNDNDTSCETKGKKVVVLHRNRRRIAVVRVRRREEKTIWGNEQFGAVVAE